MSSLSAQVKCFLGHLFHGVAVFFENEVFSRLFFFLLSAHERAEKGVFGQLSSDLVLVSCFRHINLPSLDLARFVNLDEIVSLSSCFKVVKLSLSSLFS